jgi:hypothetical protein
MMKIRPIHAGELTVFARYRDDDALNRHLEQYATNCWTAGTSRPDWCFVVEDGARIVGRAMYWALPSRAVPMDVDFLDVPWTGSYLEVGVALLQDTLVRFRRQGAETMRYRIHARGHRPSGR